ncbi:MAG: hypothetical protein AB1847_09600 [bacterium]
MRSTEVMELFNIFSETWGKEKAQLVVKDIESMMDDTKRDLTTKGDLRELELKLTKEIEQVRSSVIKWVAGLIVAQTGVIITLILLR